MTVDKNWLDPDFTPDLVSVIIPTYNRAALIEAALKSIANQEYRPIEIHIVDDGSTDETADIVAQFVAQYKDKSLSIYSHWCLHLGACAARNYGLKHSRGEFIQFLDSDDIIHPLKLSVQVNALKKTKADFVWSSTIAYQGTPDWDTEPLVGAAMSGHKSHNFIKPFIRKSCWRTESGLHRRATCAKTGPWRSMTMFQDWEYHIRMLSLVEHVEFVAGNFAGANQHDQGRIGDKWSNGTGLNGALDAISLVEEQTHTQFSQDQEWRTLILTRYKEVADLADKLGLTNVASRAKQRLVNEC
jgi:glycosyltransferase involved in cell wall biosynthesis